MITVGSLFAGIGGLDLGLERAGMQVKWQVEIDDYCNRVLAKHWPRTERLGDIRGIDWSGVPSVDLLCGGFPCQPVSVAGARKGEQDDRWLWPEFLRAICEIRPKYALVENVPGLLSIDDGRLAGRVFGDLAEAGYDSEWNCISAADVGAPHLRQRIFILAHSDECRRHIHPPEEQEKIQKHEIIRKSPLAHSEDSGPSRRLRQPINVVGFGGVGGDNGIGVPSDRSAEDVADSEGGGLEVRTTEEAIQFDAQCGDIQDGRIDSGYSRWWAVEPDVGRVADGVPSRVDRLKCLGNAVVPQVAEYIGRLIVRADRSVGQR